MDKVCLNCIENKISGNEQVNRMKCPVCDVDNEILTNVNNQLCGGCMETKPKESIKYCADCDLYLCSNCLLIHSKFKASKEHIIIELVNVESVDGNIINRVMCEKHPKIEMDLYCIDCKMVICLRCFALQHTKHEIKDIEEIIKDEKEKINNNLKLLENNLNELNIESENLIKIKEKIENNKENLIQQIDEYSKELIDEIKKRATKCKTEVTAYANKLICNVNQHESENIKMNEKLKASINSLSKMLTSYYFNNLLQRNENKNLDVQFEGININELFTPFIIRFSKMDLNLGELYVKNGMNTTFVKWLPRIESYKCSLFISERTDQLYLISTNSEKIQVYSMPTLDNEKTCEKTLQNNFYSFDFIMIGYHLLISCTVESCIRKINLKTFNQVKVHLSSFNNSMKLFVKSGNEFYFFQENSSKIGVCSSGCDDSTITLVTMIELNKPILSCLQYNEQLLCCYTEDNMSTPFNGYGHSGLFGPKVQSCQTIRTFKIGIISLKTSEVTPFSHLSFEFCNLNHIPLRADMRKKILFVNDKNYIYFLNEKFEEIFKYNFKNCDGHVCDRSNMVCDEKHGRLIFSIIDQPKLAVLQYDEYTKYDDLENISLG